MSGRRRPSGGRRDAGARYRRDVAHDEPPRADRRGLYAAAAAVVVVLAALAALVAVKLAERSASSPSGTRSHGASSAVARSVASVPAALFDQVGAGAVQARPAAISAPALRQAGKPLVLYVGAEYCPYCAAERWPMVVALSRFGRFSGLGATRSSAQDVYPNTPTFSFHGARYTSPYLAFTGKETRSNRVAGGSYAPLDTLTTAEEATITRYDQPPYVPESSKDAIPFVDFGGRYLIVGASYSPEVLQGWTMPEIAARLRNPDDPICQAVIGTANVITAALCKLTGGKPGGVCQSDGVVKAASELRA